MNVTVNNPARVTVRGAMAALSILGENAARLAIVGSERLEDGEELDFGEHGVWRVVSSRADGRGPGRTLTAELTRDA